MIMKAVLQIFQQNELPSAASSFIQKLLNIHQIYTIGINKNNKLLGALHIITLNETEITDEDFLETYTAYFSSVVENLNNTIKLKESEKKFRTIFEHSPVMIDAFDENGKCVLWNKECEKTLGYTIDEINYSEDPFSLFYPDKEVRDEVIKTVVGEADKKFREWNPRTKNGGRLSSIWANFRISDKLVISIGLDISEQKKAEKKLKEKNDQFEMIIKGANLGWWDWDIPSGDEIYNDILTENLGYKITEIKPHIKWWEDKIHPDDVEQVSVDLQKHFDGKTDFYENKHRLKTKTGQWKWFLDYGKVVEKDSKGNAIRMIGMLRNIDFEERAKEKINASLQQIKIINANTPNIIWKSDIDENGSFQNTYISEVADEFLSLPKGSIGNSWDKYFSYVLPEYLPLIDKVFKDGIENPNKLISFEYELKRADGKPMWFSSTGRVIPENKKLTVYGSTIDITQRKQNERELIEAKRKAEESDRLKSAFLANMSHEIRTPMNGILGFTELLERPNLSGEQKEKYIKIIRKSGDRMLDTVNDIIDISKIDAGQIDVSNDAINIKEEIKTHYEFFKEEAAIKGMEMNIIDSIPQNETLIITDKNKLNSIISNLIKNSIKYTDKGSIEIYCNMRGAELEFRIKDTGIGIPEDRIQSVFNRFEQADIEDTRAMEGSGLGLAITKAYVEMLGGNIGVESELGVGSTFYFTLPWIEKQVVPELIKEKEIIINAINNCNINILIAEDDDTSFEHLKIILNNVAKSIHRAISGEEAVEFVKNNANINLVLMDVKMPIMDGYTATKEIRKFNKDIIIIAQTAYALSGDKEKALAAGCNDYITKPIVMELLIEIINKHLN